MNKHLERDYKKINVKKQVLKTRYDTNKFNDNRKKKTFMRSLFEKKKQSTVQIYTLKTSQATKKIGKL